MRNESLSTRVSRHLGDDLQRRFYVVALGAMLVDLATKAMAVRALGETGIVPLFDRVTLMLVWNTGAAGGISMGPFTAQLNVLMTSLAVLLVVSVVRAIASVDPRAVLALGMVTGGALGNLASILGGHEGVADFIGLQLWGDTTIVANVADLMLWSGALLLVPIAATLVSRVRAERAGATVLPETAA
ncbi:MAG: signal peptidase II [Gemmatimonadaceae bacterium]|nr:signal peptidase II [Gemmatimonadaceae bacterium]